MKTKIIKDYSTSHTTLDTLEVTSDLFISKTHEKQYYKAIRKAKTNTKVKAIISVVNDKTWQKKYWKTFHCNSIILQNQNEFKGSLCRKRWCTHCSRIKTAELTNAYKEPLRNLGELYFITLTRPNVEGRQLRSEVDKLIKSFQRIKDNLRKTYGIKLNGMRKLEVTYNEATNQYHPHFHFIQQGEFEALALQKLWLNYHQQANIKGQDIRLIDSKNDSSLIELFKYATKETAKDDTTAKALHNIYTAIDGRRIYQTYGKLKKVKEPNEAPNEKTQLEYIKNDFEVWKYESEYKDWISTKNMALVGTLDIENNLNLTHGKTEKNTNAQRSN